MLYYAAIGKRLHLKHPRTYTEKLQWLKLYDHNPLYTTMVDKYAVKQYVADIIGDNYVIPTIGVWERPEDIDFMMLPNQFVLKTTFGGGGNEIVICRDKLSLDIDKAVSHMKRYMDQDMYKTSREWPYKNVSHRIIAEKYMEEPGVSSLTDYKVMCFNGKVKLIELHLGRYTDDHTQDFYDRDWNRIPIAQGSYKTVSSKDVRCPAKFDEMIRLSEVLAMNIPHVRVDWYIINERLYFGELTFFDASGFDPFIPDEYNYILGDWIELPLNRKQY